MLSGDLSRDEMFPKTEIILKGVHSYMLCGGGGLNFFEGHIQLQNMHDFKTKNKLTKNYLR